MHLVELAEQPYLAHDLNARVLNYVGFRSRVTGLAQWSAELESLERESQRLWKRGADPDWRSAPPEPAAVGEAREAFARFALRAGALDRERTLADWLDWLRSFADDDPWGIADRIHQVPDSRYELARLDLTGWNGLKTIVSEWAEATRLWEPDGVTLSVGRFHGRLREMLSGSAALWTDPMHGVRVLEALAAAYRSFDHVFLVGMVSGGFPTHPPTSPILDEGDRELLVRNGLPLDRRSDWDSRERQLFRVLVAGARDSLTLSYPRIDLKGREVTDSAFTEALAEVAGPAGASDPIDSIFTPGIPVYTSEAVGSHAAHAARVERLREAGTPTPYNGLIEQPALREWLASTFGDEARWSPTQIEEHAKCPWAFFSARLLRLEKPEDPDEEMDPITRGSVLHETLRRFYDAAGARVGGAVFLREADLDWAEPELARALETTLRDAESRGWIGHPALRDAKRLELGRILVRYLRWEVQQHEDLHNRRKTKTFRTIWTGVVEHEVVFDENQVALERGGVRVAYRGRIDRLEVGVDERVDAGRHAAVVDYKTSRDSVPGGGEDEAWEDGVVLQMPLYAYALTQLRPDMTVARAEYRALRQREVVHPLELKQVEAMNPVPQSNDQGTRQMERALDGVVDRVRLIRSGEFPARPAPSCGCPPFCHAWDICRVPGGPRVKREKRWR